MILIKYKYINISNIIPISLLISVEIIKLIQDIIICNDQRLVSKVNGFYAKRYASNLNEDMGIFELYCEGQVKYIFSDKTGTITCNNMKFKMMSIRGIIYGDSKDNIGNSKDNDENITE